jgi:hypothetical protein
LRAARAAGDSGYFGEDGAGEKRLIEDYECTWLYWCPGLTLERWQEECWLVGERFSLFRPFAEVPFLGFRGIVSRAGCAYRVTVAAEMDMYPKYAPWVYVTPSVAGARDDGKVVLDLHWDPGSPSFEMVIGAVVAHIERAQHVSSGPSA